MCGAHFSHNRLHLVSAEREHTLERIFQCWTLRRKRDYTDIKSTNRYASESIFKERKDCHELREAFLAIGRRLVWHHRPARCPEARARSAEVVDLLKRTGSTSELSRRVRSARLCCQFSSISNFRPSGS